MKRKHISVLSLLVFGAIAAYPQITLNGVPSRAVGTPALTVASANPNLVEGREFYAPQAVALDNSVSPPILYVSDYANNRVLAWKNANTFTSGQKADLVIGQPDFLTTFPEGPRMEAAGVSIYSTGLNHPSGLAVDSNGLLYVADAGNNRVLRYNPPPFKQTGQFPVPDLVIGQPSVAGYAANYPSGQPNAQGLYLSDGTTFLTSSLAFDSNGELWVIDSGNLRILRFNLAGATNAPSADLELGQLSLSGPNQPPLSSSNTSSYYILNQFVAPYALAFDPNGNLFVGDLNRGMVFTPPFSSGMKASSKLIGLYPQNYSFPAGTTTQQEQALVDQVVVYSPQAFFFLSGSASGVGVVDAGYSRIMVFPTFANWPTDGTPPLATAILGQPNACPIQYPNQTCKAINNGNLPGPSNFVFSNPEGVAYTGTDLFLADSGNNRVLDLPQVGGASVFGPATRVLGQDYFNTNSANLIEGREFKFIGNAAGNTYADAAMAIDNGTGTPHLYISDPYNNRVLGFKDLRTFVNGGKNKADIVLGQADFTTAMANYPTGDPNQPTKSNLYRPIGLLVDAQGNLYVADSLNSRVLRFPAPFAYAGLETRDGVSSGPAPEPADLVLGQQNFTSKISDPTATSMNVPYGLAFTPSCNTPTQACTAPNGLMVSDQADNRVLYIPTTSGTFVAGSDNGKAATIVFGQAGFNAVATGSTLAGMSNPHHISCDTNGYVYVADAANNRILIFPDPHAPGTATAGEAASVSIPGLSGPESVYANPVTGEIWVADTGNARSLRFANYQSVLLGLGSITALPEVSGNFSFHTLAVIQDQYGDLFVADDAHRVATYYPGLNVCNGASFLPASPTSSQYPSANCMPLYDPSFRAASQVLSPRPLAPGAIGTIFPCVNCSGTQFLTSQNVFNGTYPVPSTLGDVQVFVDGTAAPLYIVYPGQINFIVPNGARTSGYADLEVVQKSTGQVLGATQLPMNTVAPAAFLYPGGQTGMTVYAAAINQDNTINGPSNPAIRGQAISLYMTGQGSIPGLPPDGTPATAAISGQYPITVLLNGFDVNGSQYAEQNIQHILYSGINQYPGMWQVNVQIPATVATTAGVWFAVLVNGESNWDSGSGFRTYIYVK
jgi:uncharacterized protein (TIGR03437 family)